MWRHWRSAGAEARLARRIVIVATLVFAALLCRWQPWNLFADTGFSNNFYDVQARAFWHLRLDVPASVAGPEGFLIGGRTYLYYGPLLAVVRMPFMLVGHVFDGRLTRLSMIVAFVTACTVTFHLGRRVADLCGRAERSPRRVPMLVLAVAVSPMLALAGWTSVYHETELWALVAILATFTALAGFALDGARRHLHLAAAAATATVLIRASVGYGALAAVGLTALLLARTDRRAGLVTIGAVVAGFLANVAVNLAKFGTLLDLPADRQVLTLHDPDRAAWFQRTGGSFFSLRFLPTTLVQYLRPDAFRLERLVPFVRFGPLAHEFGTVHRLSPTGRGLLEGNTPSSSLTASATLLFVAAVIGVVLIARGRRWTFLPWFTGAAIAAAPTFLIGFVANRYLTDLLPVLVVPAAVAFTAWEVRRRTLARAGVTVLAGWGLWCNASLSVWTSELKNPTFTSVRYRLDDAVFGGTPPSVERLTPGAPVPRDGVVAIDGQCAGLYIAEQGKWAVLERADGVRHLTGTLDTSAAVTSGMLVAADEGDLTVTRSADGLVTFHWRPADGTPVDGTPQHVNAHARFDLVSDPVAGGLAVTVDGHGALFAFAAPALASSTIDPSITAVSSPDHGTPVCNRLDPRLPARG